MVVLFTYSENYVIRWSQKGLPKDLDLLNNLRVLFSVRMSLSVECVTKEDDPSVVACVIHFGKVVTP